MESPPCSLVSEGRNSGGRARCDKTMVQMIDEDEDEEEGSSLSSEREGNRVYDFDDDFPSIGASESTHPRSKGGLVSRRSVSRRSMGGEEKGVQEIEVGRRALKDREGSGIVGDSCAEEVDFGRGISLSFGNGSRVSFASGLRRRMSWCQTREERLRARLMKVGVDDSVLKDCREVKMRKTTGRARMERNVSGSVASGGKGMRGGCVSLFIARIFRKGDEEMELKKEKKEGFSTVMEEKTIEDVHFLSMLAYEDFMHSPSRRSGVAKVLSRLRRS